jgi:predicted MFS family arabinose efflux permease
LFAGDVLVTVAERYFVLIFTLWLLARPGAGARQLGLLLTLESLPVLAVGLLSGPLLDRLNKKHCMLAAAAGQGVIVGVVALLLARQTLTFTQLCIAGSLLGCLIPIFEGAVNAAVPQAVTEHRLLAAAAVQSTTLELSNIVAATLAATLLAGFGFEVAVAVNAALYALGCVCLFRLRTAAFEGRPSEQAYAHELKAGLTLIAGKGPLRGFVAVYVTKLLLLAPLLVVFPMLVQAVLGGAVRWVAILETAFSLAAIGAAAALSLNASARGLHRAYATALAVLSLAMLVLARLSQPYAMVAVVVLMGGAVAALLALSNMFFHQSVPDAVKGRFFGTLETLAAAAAPAGFALLGLIAERSGVQQVLVLDAAALLLLAAVTLLLPRRR